MTLFQWISLSVLGLLLVRELARVRNGPISLRFRLFRCLVWLGAAVTIADPMLVQRLAMAVGIGRGADVVLYLFVLTSIGTSFCFYSRYVRLQRQITELVRYLAIRDVTKSAGESSLDSA